MAPNNVLQWMVIIFVLLFIIHRYRAMVTERQANSRVHWSEVECSRGMSILTQPQLHCTWRSLTEILLKTKILGLLSKHLRVSSWTRLDLTPSALASEGACIRLEDIRLWIVRLWPLEMWSSVLSGRQVSPNGFVRSYRATYPYSEFSPT